VFDFVARFAHVVNGDKLLGPVVAEETQKGFVRLIVALSL